LVQDFLILQGCDWLVILTLWRSQSRETMNNINLQKPALILIDIQKGFDDAAYWGNRNNPDAEQNASILLNLWRQSGWPVFHVQHCSTNPQSKLAEGSPGHAIQDIVAPLNGEPVIRKNVNSAFIGTDLREQLDRSGVRSVVIVGLTTDHCVSTTTRMAGNFGYDTYLVSDATATFDKTGFDGKIYPAALIHETALASIHGEFATVVPTGSVVSALKK
jgi:nicotinamidase-related amidase